MRGVLAAAVSALGGQERAGQVQMAEAVADAMVDGKHLLVQAGTGTGKSLAYLVPSLLHDQRVVVATATLALQHQLVERDIPRLVEAVERPRRASTRRTPCSRAAPTTPACTASARACPTTRARWSRCPQGSMAKKVLELRAWAEEEAEQRAAAASATTRPRHTDREWRQVSVSHRECLGAAQVPVRRRSASSSWPARRPTAPT